MKKGREKKKNEKSDKTHVKYLYQGKMTAKKYTKTGKNFRGGEKNFSGWPEYIPLTFYEYAFKFWK